MNDVLIDALLAARSRLESGVAEAERELARARLRSRELRRSIAVDTTRAGARSPASPAQTMTPRVITVPDLPEPAPVPGAATAGGDEPRAALDVPEAGRAAKQLPRAWRVSLARLRRGNPTGADDLFSRNVIVRWEGTHPLAGTYLGNKAAAAFVERLAERVQTRATRLEHILRQGDNLEIVASITFLGPAGEAVAARVTNVFRLDEDARLALWFASPEDAAALDAVLRDATAP